MPVPESKTEKILSKWKPEGYDWGSATKIVIGEDPTGYVHDPEKTRLLGFSDRRAKLIWINPVKSQFKGIKSQGQTVAHEISHWKLDHSGRGPGPAPGYPKHDPSQYERFWSQLVETRDRVTDDVGMGNNWEWVQELLHELEVRLNMELQGYSIDLADGFIEYYKEALDVANPRMAYLVREAAHQALRNMEKRDILPRKAKMKYWRAVDFAWNAHPSRHTVPSLEDSSESLEVIEKEKRAWGV